MDQSLKNTLLVANHINFSFLTPRSVVWKRGGPGLCSAKCETGRLSPQELTVGVSGCNSSSALVAKWPVSTYTHVWLRVKAGGHQEAENRGHFLKRSAVRWPWDPVVL